MSLPEKNILDKIDHLFRHEYGKLVSVLTKTFGTSNIELAEDVVQEAMLEALKQWSFKGVPNNPVGWIYNVAKFKAVNIVNREQYKRKFTSETAHLLRSEWTVEPALNHIFTDKEIEDDQLRMIFTCCHPEISTDSQVALTLKTLCGFSVSEIASAFLTTQDNINKRLIRARKTIRTTNIPFEVPVGKELEKRLKGVLETIYLLFNEGYNTISSNGIIRYELCEEAMRLAEILVSNATITSTSNTYALLALMSLNASRFKSRIDEQNIIINLENQDRSKWNKDLIKQGLHYLEISAKQNEVSIYLILATISAHHCTTTSYKNTDWKGILSLYDMLTSLDKSPIILLNRAVVISIISGADKALKEIDMIKDTAIFDTYLPYYTTKAELHFRNNEKKIAEKLLQKALKLPIGNEYKSFINNKLNEYHKK